MGALDQADVTSDNSVMPGIGGKTFSMEDNGQYEKFPGAFVVFNGEKSVLKKVDQGNISFSPDSTDSAASVSSQRSV